MLKSHLHRHFNRLSGERLLYVTISNDKYNPRPLRRMSVIQSSKAHQDMTVMQRRLDLLTSKEARIQVCLEYSRSSSRI